MTTSTPTRSTGAGIGLSVLIAGVAAGLVNAVISLVALAAGADPGVSLGLVFPVYVVFGFVGVLAGAVGWHLIRTRAARPRALLRWLVPVVVLVSLVPNILLLTAGMGVAGPIALGLMHVAVAAVAVPVYARLLPLPR